jgi:hypothetical protein
LVRGSGLAYYSTSFSIIDPMADRVLLLVCSAAILLTLELRIRHLGHLKRLLLPLPALALADFELMPAVLLPFGAVGTVACIAYMILNSSDLLGVSPGKSLASFLVITASAPAAIFLLSAVRWVLNPIDGGPPLSGWTWSASVLALRLLNQPYALLPRLALLLFISWPLRLLFAGYWGELKHHFERLTSRFYGTRRPDVPGLAPDGSALPSMVAMAASLVGALFAGLYPYFPKLNPNSLLVGYDVRVSYLAKAELMVDRSPLAAVGYAFQNDRTGYLLLQYALAQITGSVDLAVRLVPSLLAVLLVLSTYFFVRSGEGDRLTAATASLFAAFSFSVVAGINGGIYASWLAMSEGFLFLGLLLTGLNRRSRRHVALSAAASVLVLLTHPWAWFMVMGVVATYGIITWTHSLVTRDRENLRFDMISVAAILFVNLVADSMKHFAGRTTGLQDVYASSLSSLSLANLPHVLSALASTVNYFLGGAFDNPIVFAFALLGVFTMSSLSTRMNRLLVSWLAVASVGILFSGFSQLFLQARIIDLVPLQVLAAMGSLSTLRYLTRLMATEGTEHQRLVKAFIALAYMSVFGAMVGYALQNVGFLWTG